ncbi:Cation/acetate symporter ActP [bacterium HR39]|nr:Cation/acetate symporter ActP [bacterium HR39]
MQQQRDAFVANLGKIYGIYTGGFLAFVIFLAILEQLGVPNYILGYLFVFLTLAVYAGIGILSRTTQISEYYVAGRRVPAVYNGMATAADWMSAASFIGMAGSLYLLGYDGLAFVLGWTGGYVLVATLIAPYLRKFGAYTVPDFLAARYGGNFARLIGVIILFSCSMVYLMGQLKGTGVIASRLLGIPVEYGVFVGLVGILVCSMLGGMRAVTWTQVAQYIVLIVAYLIPVTILSAQRTGVPVPQIMYGQVLQRITELETQYGITKHHVAPFVNEDPLNFFALVLCLMIGTAALPHVIMRFFTTPSVREARTSVGWALFFIFLLYFTAPAYAAFAKLEIFENVIGKAVDSLESIQQLPAWVFIYGKVGLVTICGQKAVDPQTVLQACQQAGITALAFDPKVFSIDRDVVVISMPEVAGLPYVIAGLVAAGGLAAALSTADGLLLAMANALSHDIYYKMIDPSASTARRLVVARGLLFFVAALAAYLTITAPAHILAYVSWAFSLAAAGLFPALVLGVMWKNANTPGAIAGMIGGFGVTLFYIVATNTGWMQPWFGVRNISAALFGLPVSFILTWAVSKMTTPPPREIQEFVEQLRIPRGPVLMEEARREG